MCVHGLNNTQENIWKLGENQMLITGGGHHWDSYGILNLTAEPQFIQEAHEWEIRKVQTWLTEWNQTHEGSARKRDEL